MKVFKKPADKSAAEVHAETLPKPVIPAYIFGFGVKAGGGRRADRPRGEVISGNASSQRIGEVGRQMLDIARNLKGS